MTTLSLSAAALLQPSAMRGLLGAHGPCITLLLPAYRPGEAAPSWAGLLKSAVQEGEKNLSAFLPDASVARLLDPLKEAADQPEFSGGSHWGRAIFRAPSVFQQFQLTRPVGASLTVSGSFLVRPLINELSQPEAFYILSLAKTRIAAFRCRGANAERVKVPGVVAEVLSEALDFEPPDHDLENRSYIGGSTTGMSSVRFGTGSERERKHSHLADFYKSVDRGLKELAGVRAEPLILAGVEEDADIFRSISNYPNLIREGIAGSVVMNEPDEGLLQKAYAILRADAATRHAAALRFDKERVTLSRWSTDPDFLLHAAFEGRIENLYVNGEAQKFGVFERGSYHSWGQEDLLNLAAVQTMLHQGKARELAAATMPDNVALAGILRY